MTCLVTMILLRVFVETKKKARTEDGGPCHLSKGIDSDIFKEPLKEDDQIIHN